MKGVHRKILWFPQYHLTYPKFLSYGRPFDHPGDYVHETNHVLHAGVSPGLDQGDDIVGAPVDVEGGGEVHHHGDGEQGEDVY